MTSDPTLREMAIRNIFSDIPSRLTEERIETLVASGHVRIERIVSQGHASPKDFWYDQDQNEFVMLLKGEARLRFENQDDPLAMSPGDVIAIPAHRKHRVEWTTPDEPTVWLAIHYA